MGNARTVGAQLATAGTLHWILEINILGHPDLGIKQGGATLVTQLLPVVLQAANHPG